MRCLLSLALLTAAVSACVGTVEVPRSAQPEGPPAEASPPTPVVPSPAAEGTPPYEPLSPLVRRVTRDQLAYVVDDVLGVALPARLVAQLPPDRPLAGFAHLAEGQTALPEHVLGYAAIARHVAESPELEPFLEAHRACGATSDATCRRAFVESAAAVLFRGRTSPESVARLARVYEEVAALADADTGRRAALEVMLQSPRFLYLVEDEDAPDALALALATRLSFALWSSAPDAALLEAARAGGLSDRAGLEAEARRLLADATRSARPWRRFVIDWARLASLPDEDGLKAELEASAVAFLSDRLRAGRSVLDLFSAEADYLTPALARARGLEPTGPGVRPYPPRGPASGFLVQPGVIAGMTNADGGAIVARGLFLQAQLFCGAPPDPPETLQEAIDAFAAEQPEGASERSIAERRLERSECAACHAQFDPLAYAFEGFDHRGRPRAADEHGNPVRVNGWIPAAHREDGEAAAYADLAGWIALVRGSPRVKRCLTESWLELLRGRSLGRGQSRAVAEVASALEAGANDWASLVLLAVGSPVFREDQP